MPTTNVRRISQLKRSVRGIDTDEVDGGNYTPVPPPTLTARTWSRNGRTFVRRNRATVRATIT